MTEALGIKCVVWFTATPSQTIIQTISHSVFFLSFTRWIFTSLSAKIQTYRCDESPFSMFECLFLQMQSHQSGRRAALLLMYVVCAGAKFFSLKPNMILAKRSWGKGKKKTDRKEEEEKEEGGSWNFRICNSERKRKWTQGREVKGWKVKMKEGFKRMREWLGTWEVKGVNSIPREERDLRSEQNWNKYFGGMREYQKKRKH